MKSFIKAFSIFALWMLSANALAQVMDFDFFPATAACPDGANGVTQNGLRIVDDTPIPPTEPDSCVLGAANNFPEPPGVPTNGTSVFGFCGECGPDSLTLTLTRLDAAPFNLISIDFSRFPGPVAGTVNITGFPAGGGSPILVQHNINSDDWVTVDLSALSNVQRVEIVHDTFPSIDTLLDNIVTSSTTFASSDGATPVPAMGLPLLWLLGALTMLIALAGLRSRR